MTSRSAVGSLTILIAVLAWTVQAMQSDGVRTDAGGTQFEAFETTYMSGKIEIATTILVPIGGGKHPGVVLIQGAGESSRKNLWALQIGEHLASRGILTCLPDKRGTGDSGGDWKTASFEDLAADIAGAVTFLAQRSDIDGKAIGVIGLSQGGFYAPIVANESRVVAFVGAVSASVMSFEETINHEMANTFREDGLIAEAHEQAMQVQLSALKFARDGRWEDYISTRDKVLKGPAASAVEGFPSSPDHWLWTWVAKVIDFDPIIHWRRVSQPIFFAFGQNDEEENVPVIKSLALIQSELSANHDVAVHLYSESGHALYDPVQAKEGRGAIREDFADDLSSWIKNLQLEVKN